MNNKKLKMIVFLFVTMFGFLFLGTNVYAEEGDAKPTKIQFYSTIHDWKNNNDLSYSCGTAVNDYATITPHLYYGTYENETLGTLTEFECDVAFSTLGWDENQVYRIVEEYDFSEYRGHEAEFEEFEMTPGRVISSTFQPNDPAFAYYEPSEEETAVVYNINHLDDQGRVTSEGLYVYHASLVDPDDSKLSEMNFGDIYIPTYCIRFRFSARGNIASAYGTFYYDIFSNPLNQITSEVTGGDVEPVTICELSGNPIGLGDINDILDSDPNNGDISYVGVNNEEQYEYFIIDGDEEREQNIIYHGIEVSAYLNSDLSQTGIVYRIIPFIVLIGLMVSGYIVIRKNRVKE